MGYGGGADRYGGPPSRGGGGFPSAESATASGASAPNAPGMLQQGSVLMVYGLNMEKINCTRLFNLFCLYGNVVRVSFLPKTSPLNGLILKKRLCIYRIAKFLHSVRIRSTKKIIHLLMIIPSLNVFR